MEKKGCTLHGEDNLVLQAAAWLLLPLAFLTKKQACCEAGKSLSEEDGVRAWQQTNSAFLIIKRVWHAPLISKE